ncbi:uncharacterized protein LOC130809390 [Amaranthus tricolor]|uniref:uncharacterized protein LOC130809390 n=1 Tax=Amaranthus tricolor TaxID=29722 RepID=UPI00258B34EB|nr:uncharacterized protein LOC130809390 [Amaranthus tricolor]
MVNPTILLKLHQSSSNTINATPNDWYNAILLQINEWLAIFPNFFHSLSLKFSEIFSTLAQWLTLAAPYILALLGVILICFLSYCFLSCIISLIFLVLKVIWCLISGFFKLLWRLISGFYMMVLNICKSIGSCCSRCGKMMKAPGTAGKVIISRAIFEANPQGYFSALRASN